MKRVVRWHATGETILGWLKRILPSDGKVVRGEKEHSKRADERKQLTMTEFAFETGRTPEAYVVELLSAHDGEMHQQEIIAETSWSRSSVSRLLCEMEATDAVVRVRFGAENMVYLPETAPELVHEFESPPVAHS